MEKFMEAAIEEAKISLNEGGIPIGAVLVYNDEIIARGRNMNIQKKDPFAHAIIECLRNAGSLQPYSNTILVCTHMPCYICAGAIIHFGIEQFVVGDTKIEKGDPDFLKDHWVTIDDWNIKECKIIMEEFIQKNSHMKKDSIGFF